MPTRRAFFRTLGATAAAGLGLAAYAFYVEPALELVVRRWRLRPKGWPEGVGLRIAVLTDLHASEPYMDAARIRRIVARANALAPDLTVVLGDLPAASRFITRALPVAETAGALSGLRARLGVYAVLGNHDWWADPAVMRGAAREPAAMGALSAAGIEVLHNRALPLGSGRGRFWLAGLGDQLAYLFRPDLNGGRVGVHDLAGTLAQVEDGRPVVMLAHEPDIFARMPARVGLTLCGHTHGGQVRLLGWSPVVPSRFGNRYAYGPVFEAGRHMVVSGGLGYSKIPVRFGVPPEITLVDIPA